MRDGDATPFVPMDGDQTPHIPWDGPLSDNEMIDTVESYHGEVGVMVIDNLSGRNDISEIYSPPRVAKAAWKHLS